VQGRVDAKVVAVVRFGRWVGGEVRLVKGLRVAEKRCASEQVPYATNNSCQARSEEGTRWRKG
jgi:hypothetical protein